MMGFICPASHYPYAAWRTLPCPAHMKLEFSVAWKLVKQNPPVMYIVLHTKLCPFAAWRDLPCPGDMKLEIDRLQSLDWCYRWCFGMID